MKFFLLSVLCLSTFSVAQDLRSEWTIPELLQEALKHPLMQYRRIQRAQELELGQLDFQKNYRWGVEHNALYETNENQSLGLYDPGERRQTQVDSRIKKSFPTGTQISAGVSVLESSSKSESRNISGYEVASDMKVEQSLWRNAWGRQNDIERQLAELNAQSKVLQWHQEESDELKTVVDMVLDFKKALLLQESAGLMLAKEHELVAMYRKRFRNGIIPVEEALQMDERLLQRREQVASRDIETLEAWQQLLLKMDWNLQQGDVVPQLKIATSPLTEKNVCAASEPFEHPQFLKLQKKIEIAQRDLDHHRESMKPDGVFSVSSRLNGTAESFGESVGGLGNPKWQMKFSLQYTLSDSSQDAAHRRKVAEKQQLALNLVNWRKTWVRQKTILCRRHQNAKNSLKRAHDAMGLAKGLLASQERSYKNGLLPFLSLSISEQDVLQKQENIEVAKINLEQMNWETLHHLGFDLSNLHSSS